MRIQAVKVGFHDGALVQPGEEVELPAGSALPAWAIDLDAPGVSPLTPADPKMSHAHREQMTLRQVRGEAIPADRYFEVAVPKRRGKASGGSTPS